MIRLLRNLSFAAGSLVLTMLAAVTVQNMPAAGFSIEDGRLIDARGNDFIIRGVSYPHVWFQNRTAQAIPDIAATNANAVRVVLGNGKRWGPNSAQDVANLIQLCKDNALIAILEVHDTTGFGEEPAAATIDEAVTYWISIKNVLMGQEDFVIINLGNEPFGNNQPANSYVTAHTNGIIRLRNEGFTHTLMIDGANWGQDNLGIMRTNAPAIFASDVLSNTVFSVHMYQVYGNPVTVNTYLSAFRTMGLPIVVGEFAFEHNPGQNVAEEEIMLRCEEYGIGYIGWSWSGNGGGVEALDMVNNFNAASLTPWGQIIFNGPNGITTTSETATVFGADAPPAVAVSASTITLGDQATLSVTSTEDPDATFQWQMLDGDWQDIPGATASTLILPSTQRFHATEYRAIAYTNRVPSASSSVLVNVQAPPPSNSRLTSLSTRGLSLTGDDVLIPGFGIQGSGTKRLLIRAVGPTLANFPFLINGVLPDPTMILRSYNGTSWDLVAANDNWQDNANAAEIEQTASDLFAFALQEDLDSALLVDLPTGQYTVVASGVGGTTGIAIVELYDADSVSTASMTSISNRGFVGVGDEVMIPGFAVSIEGPKTFLIRVVGPGLAGAPFNVQGTMDDPQLTLFRRETNGFETKLLSNDNWSDNPDAAYTEQITAQVFAFDLQPGSADAAVVVTLEPGVYTVVGSAADGVSSGVVIVEVYVVQ